MADSLRERRCAEALAACDVRINGSRPWDLAVHDQRLYRRIATRGISGFCDAYVDGWWSCDALDELFARLIRGDLGRRLWMNHIVIGRWIREHLVNLQSARRAFRNGQAHYDLGKDLFTAMLDRRLTYSCGYWAQANTLDEAQEAKLDLICRKLDLRPGMRVLDIGCGWGSFVNFAAERYGCDVVGITVSPQQADVARQRAGDLPVEVRLQDYRSLNERFDRVVSIGMFEHVGPKNYRTYMQTVSRCLNDDGLSLLHFFATQRSWPNLVDTEVIWVARHIFPNMVVPSLRQVARAMEGLFVVEDLHNFGADYDPTLMAWHENFQRAWPQLSDRYGERFRRLWTLYLLVSAGAFRCRKYQVWQFVLSRYGVEGGWRAARETSVAADAATTPAHEAPTAETVTVPRDPGAPVRR